MAVVRKGNALSDTVCDSEANSQTQTSTSEPHTEAVYTTATTRPVMSTVSAISDSMTPYGQTDSTFTTTAFVMSSETILTYPTKPMPPNPGPGSTLGTVTDLVFLSSHNKKNVRSNQCFNMCLFLPLCCLCLSVAVIAGVAGVIVLLIFIIILLVLFKPTWKKGNCTLQKSALIILLFFWKSYDYVILR